MGKKIDRIKHILAKNIFCKTTKFLVFLYKIVHVIISVKYIIYKH